MRRSVLAVGAAVVLSAAAFHLSLVSAIPGKGETLASAPSMVTLTFSATVNVRVSAISILAPDSTEVAKLVPRAAAKSTVVEADVPRRLPSGRYIVRWRTAAADGHVIRGSYGFTINPVE